ncbi:MAG: iron ABC transporter permease [Neomegalonema sp.]|nr:iron ABC transporter permease [Neomegalonema sp.]
MHNETPTGSGAPKSNLSGFAAGARRYWRSLSALDILAALTALLIAAPVASIAISVFGETTAAWDRLAGIVLPRYALNTLMLAGLVAAGVSIIGVTSAWLTVMTRFPGRRLLEVMLILPLAFPAYVVAYAYTDLLDHPGMVQTWLREVTGWGPRDYWFPEVRSLPGAAAMLILVLYPYVYLLARAAFLNQSAAALDVARTLGHRPMRVFFRVALPMARPAIVTGVALALMETLADFGVVSYFGVQTFATGIYKAWTRMDDVAAAAQLSGWLLVFVFALIALERAQRGAARTQDARAGFKTLAETKLTGLRALLAVMLCGAPVLLGFVIPLITLAWMSITGGHAFFGARYIGFALNSLTLAGIGAAATVGLAIIMAYAARLSGGRAGRFATLVASMGYAVPGVVIGIGLLTPFGIIDNAYVVWAADATKAFERWTGLDWFPDRISPLLIGSIFAVVFAYVVRFMSVALQTVDAALGKVTPSMDHAARALGEGPSGALRRVHAPMISGGILTAALIVFVDILKELPATLILRPFDFDTLAIQAYRLAADERLEQASTPSLAIGLLGLLPVILLSMQIRRSRPGARAGGS